MTTSLGIKHNRVLAALSPDDLNWMIPRLEPVSMRLHEELTTAGAQITHVHFPLSGLVSTVAPTRAGPIEVGMVGREGLVGTPVVLGVHLSPRTSVVQLAGEALRVRADVLQTALLARPTLFRPLACYVQTLISQMAQTIQASTDLTLEGRLARWLLMAHDRLDSEELVLTHSFLATLLGVRRPGITTTTHVLEGAGMITTRRGHITILDRPKLIELAGDAYQPIDEEYAHLLRQSDPAAAQRGPARQSV